MSNNSSTRTRTTYTAASLPPLPEITQEIVSAYPMVCQRITKLDNKLAGFDNLIQSHQEQPEEDSEREIAFLQLEITGATAELWWWLNLQNKIVIHAGLADLIRAHEEGRLTGWEYMREVSVLHTALAAGVATFR